MKLPDLKVQEPNRTVPLKKWGTYINHWKLRYLFLIPRVSGGIKVKVTIMVLGFG